MDNVREDDFGKLGLVMSDQITKEGGGMKRELYPDNWEEISKKIRKRSKGQCECEGFCGLHRGRRCEERQGQKAKWAKGKVVLTVAHLTHNPQDCRPKYLKAMCQRCHLRYDRLLKERFRQEKKNTLLPMEERPMP